MSEIAQSGLTQVATADYEDIPYRHVLWCAGVCHLFMVRSDGSLKWGAYRAALPLSLNDGQLTPNEFVRLRQFTGASVRLMPDPLGEFVAYGSHGPQRRQRTHTGVFRIARPESHAVIDHGWDMAFVTWSPRGTFCVSAVVGLRSEPLSIKVLTRVDIERLLEQR